MDHDGDEAGSSYGTVDKNGMGLAQTNATLQRRVCILLHPCFFLLKIPIGHLQGLATHSGLNDLRYEKSIWTVGAFINFVVAILGMPLCNIYH